MHWTAKAKQRCKYSPTSRKRPPEMRRVSSRLREVVAYESRTAGGLLREDVRTHIPFEENVLHAIFRLQ